MREFLALERQLQRSGELTPEQVEESEKFCREVEAASAEEIEAYDFFFRHLPESEDLALLILKGHLLIEHRTREFVLERLYTPRALEPARLTSAQVAFLAEAMCLPNALPQFLWDAVRRLNSLRNQLAHNLEPKGIIEKVEASVQHYRSAYPETRDLVDVLAHLYAQLAELVRLARDPAFKLGGKA